MAESLSNQIEKEFLYIRENPESSREQLYKLLYRFLGGFISGFLLKTGFSNNEYIVEDLVQETVVDILKKDFSTIDLNRARFSTYCCVIAKNKAINYTDYLCRHRTETDEEIEQRAADTTPEKEYLRLERIELAKKYLTRFVEFEENKPYRLVSSCYTILLYKLMNLDSRRTSSPDWAMEQLSEKNVEAGADDFIVAMKSYLPDLNLYWSDEFLDHMDDELYGSLIRELIFQEHFTKKDFENWATRMRKIIVGQISLEEYQEAVNEMEW